MDRTTTQLLKNAGPVRTLRVGERVTVYGDLEIVGIEGRRVTVRVVPASLPPPTAALIPARRE